MGTWWTAAWGMGLGGCLPVVSLSEVPIDGGTDVQRALIEAELADFARMAGPGRIELREIAFTHVNGVYLARYSSVTKRVKIGPNVVDDELRGVLRHELCHALDFREDLAKDQAVLDRLGVFYRQSGMMDQTRVTSTRREAFASLCGAGAPVVAALTQSCDGDPEEVTAAAPWVLDVAWPLYEAVADVSVVGELRTDLRDAGGYSTGDAWLADADGRIDFFDPQQARWVTPREAGEPVHGDPVEAPGWFGELTGPVGWEEGPAAAVLTARPTSAPRLMTRDPDGDWAPAGCVGEPSIPFVTPDRTWTLSRQLDGDGDPLVTVIEVL